RFNTENRERVGRILLESFGGNQLDWTLQVSESLLVRVHYIVHTTEGVPDGYDVAEIEQRLVQATRAWTDDLRAALIAEHGARVMDERPYGINPRGAEGVWIYDFGLRAHAEDVERVRDLFEDVFLGARRGRYEDDGLAGLVLAAGLTGREITVLRAVARYLR